ncbi:MAG TPA: FtsX-like permease family protein [Candidatus Limnocylindrales bacterium]|nr:FtsX-like permease family protein [Candidatus Limnocylindrales bacterium]
MQRGLRRLAWRGLRARPLRTGLTIAGVALGVAVVFAGLATNAGIGAAIDRSVAARIGRADLRIAAFGEGGLSDLTLDTIRRTPGVEVAAPAFEQRTYLGADPFGPGPLPAPVTIVGIDPEAEWRLHDLSLAGGSALRGDAADDAAAHAAGDATEALVSATLASADGLGVGSTIELQGVDAPIPLRVVGIVTDAGAWADAAGRAVIVPLDVARTAFALNGLSRIDVGVAASADSAAVTKDLQAALVSQPYVLSSPRDLASTMAASTGDFAATTALITAVALFAGAFLIFNTLSMTVVERVRELGLLRAAGATRGQITTYILIQAAVIAVIGSVVGIGLGAAIATGMAGWLRTVGSVSLGAPRLTPSDALLAVLVGLVVTLAAAIEPARRAGRVAPVEALKARLDLPAARRARLRWLIAVFALVGGIGLLLWPGASGGTAAVRALTVYGILLVVALAVPFVLPGLARTAGLPFALLARLEERLARASVLRDRARAALTVGALTVGLAMVVALGGVGQHARAAAGAWIADVVPGDLVVTSIFPRGLDEGLDEALGATAGVASVSPVGTFDLSVGGVRRDGAAMVGADLAADGRLRFIGGDRDRALAALDRGGAVIVPATLAAALGATLGSRLDVTAADGSARTLEVVGIAERTLPGSTGESLLVGWPEAERLGVAGADAYAVRFEPRATTAQRAELEATARSLALDPVAVDRIRGAIGEALDRVFGLFDVLSLVAVIVAALGIVNTLTMNVLERVREIGVLRAAGMTRSQVWRSVVVEAGITGLVGALCGVLTGLAIGALMVAFAGGEWDLATSIPWLPVAVAFGLGVALAMLAAAYPARLASGVSIVRAVGYE